MQDQVLLYIVNSKACKGGMGGEEVGGESGGGGGLGFPRCKITCFTSKIVTQSKAFAFAFVCDCNSSGTLMKEPVLLSTL